MSVHLVHFLELINTKTSTTTKHRSSHFFIIIILIYENIVQVNKNYYRNIQVSSSHYEGVWIGIDHDAIHMVACNDCGMWCGLKY